MHIIHATNLIRLCPTTDQDLSLLQLALGCQPNILHLCIFGYIVYVLIAPTHQTKLGPQCRLGIYVGFQSLSVIKYIEPLTCEVFIVRFTDYHFDENVFPPLGGRKANSRRMTKNYME